MPSDCQASDPQRKRVLLIVEHFSIKTKEQRSKGFYCHFFFVFRNMQMNQNAVFLALPDPPVAIFMVWGY